MKACWKKVSSVSVALALVLTAMTGCQGSGTAGDGEKSGTDSASGGQAMGRYLEEEAALPEEAAMVLDMVRLKDGKVRILGMEESGAYSVWDSADNGENWETAGELPADSFGETGIWIGQAALSPSGEGFLCEYTDDGGMNYYYMTAKLQVEEVKLELEELDLEGAEAFGYVTGEGDVPGEAGSEAEADEPEEAGGEAEAGEPEEAGSEAEAGEPEEAGSEAEESESEEAGSASYDMTEMEMQNTLFNVKYSQDGVLFGNDYNNQLYQIDPRTGKIEKEVASGVQTFDIAGNTIITEDTASGIVLYDAASGEVIEQDQVLAEVLGSGGGMTSYVAGVKNFLFQAGDEENSLYYCNKDGLYRHILGGSVNEQLIDGGLNSLGGPDTGMVAMAVMDDGTFLVLISQSNAENKLLRYTYSKDTPSRPSKELKLYALYDNTEIRQAISMFQKENADYYINFEVGLSGEDGTTVSDALKTLNAELMAGKGPDILILDGMPVQSYIEKGLLCDLTDIFHELKEGDGCFETIAGTYGTESGICAIPSRFGIPILEGSGELLEASGDLAAFADKIEELRGQDAEIEGIVECSSPEVLAEKLYQSYSPALLKEDGSLDEAQVKNFYTQLKRIYDTGNYTDETIENVSYTVGAAGAAYLADISMSSFELLYGKMKANMGILKDISGFNQVMAVNEKMNLESDLFRLAGKNVYCPETVLGISSKSSQTEEAEEFVRYVLGKEVQTFNQGGGFPVNVKAYEESVVDTSGGDITMSSVANDIGTGEMVTLEVYWASQEELAALREKIESLDTPSLTDSVIGDAVKEQAVKCLDGECTVDEAVSSLVQKVNLYMAE